MGQHGNCYKECSHCGLGMQSHISKLYLIKIHAQINLRVNYLNLTVVVISKIFKVVINVMELIIVFFLKQILYLLLQNIKFKGF